MGLLSVFKSNHQAAPQYAEPRSANVGSSPDESIQQARTLARHRLMGTAVLVLIGVLVFPVLFETQPRPVAIDIPIQIPRNDSAPPLVMPRYKPASPQAPMVEPALTEARPEGVDGPPLHEASAPFVTEPAKQAAAVASAPLLAALARTESVTASTPVAVSQRGSSMHLESPSRPGSSDEKPRRFIVQAGSFAEGSAAQDVRSKLEKLGFKTFVQVVETSEGKRIRVRVGPWTSKEEAEKVLARVKAAGISALVLVL